MSDITLRPMVDADFDVVVALQQRADAYDARRHHHAVEAAVGTEGDAHHGVAGMAVADVEVEVGPTAAGTDHHGTSVGQLVGNGRPEPSGRTHHYDYRAPHITHPPSMPADPSLAQNRCQRPPNARVDLGSWSAARHTGGSQWEPDFPNSASTA